MKFTVRLFIQKHHNRTYTILAPAFPGISAYGPTVEECKQEMAEALAEHLAEVEPQYLHQVAFRPNQTLEKVTVELRPVDARGKRQRDKVSITLSLLLTAEEEGRILVGADSDYVNGLRHGHDLRKQNSYFFIFREDTHA